jgi:hypothetical protein
LIIKAYARGAPLRESYYFTQVRYFARLSRFTPVSGICIYSGTEYRKTVNKEIAHCKNQLSWGGNRGKVCKRLLDLRLNL